MSVHPAGLANRVGRSMPPASRWSTPREIQARLLARLRGLDPDRFGKVTERDLVAIRSSRGMSNVTLALQRLVDRAEGC